MKHPNEEPEQNVIFTIPFHEVTAKRYYSIRSQEMRVIVAIEKTDVRGLELWFSPDQTEALIAVLQQALVKARQFEALTPAESEER